MFAELIFWARFQFLCSSPSRSLPPPLNINIYVDLYKLFRMSKGSTPFGVEITSELKKDAHKNTHKEST